MKLELIRKAGKSLQTVVTLWVVSTLFYAAGFLMDVDQMTKLGCASIGAVFSIIGCAYIYVAGSQLISSASE